MSRILAISVIALLVATVGFLAAWDMPAPTTKVEKVIPNDRFKQ